MFIFSGMNENEVPISTCCRGWVYCLSFWYHNFNSNSVESKKGISGEVGTIKVSRLPEYQQHHQQQQHFSMKQNTPEVYNKRDYFVNIFFPYLIYSLAWGTHGGSRELIGKQSAERVRAAIVNVKEPEYR